MFYLMYLFGLISFTLKRKHFFLMLLVLEFIVISLLFCMLDYIMNTDNNDYYMVTLIILSTCESALGLSLLVMKIRMTGKDFMSSNMMW